MKWSRFQNEPRRRALRPLQLLVPLESPQACFLPSPCCENDIHCLETAFGAQRRRKEASGETRNEVTWLSGTILYGHHGGPEAKRNICHYCALASPACTTSSGVMNESGLATEEREMF